MNVQYRSLRSKLTDCPSAARDGLLRILDLDFSKQKEKFVVDPDFVGWDESNIEAAEVLYKNFLYLLLRFPDMWVLPPSRDIDDFWHGHILDTKRYSSDCHAIFGRMLHHNPYFGYGSQAARDELAQSFETTQRLHQQEFGSPIVEVREIC